MRWLTLLPVLLTWSCASTTSPPVPPKVSNGQQIAFTRDKGNCLACHKIDGGEFPGNIGPPLKNLRTRFNSKQQLREQIWDATQFNPQTSMPPFGKNKILTETEIDQIVDYLWTL